jgi:2,4-dienoyl-CoA reductase-like NADH-dependent reductase (Old Yellow Enzyme family)
MSSLFEATTIGGMELDNRFMRAAMWLGMAGEDGTCTSKLIDVMSEYAVGGVGLIFTGHAYVLKGGQAGPWQLGCHSDLMLPGLTELVKSIHNAGGKIALQLAHGGIFSVAELTGEEPLGPSPLQTEDGPLGREMSTEEIQQTVEAFGAAAVRAKEAGFDGVQIHAAHSYLLSQFLSPFFNKRTDNYGGPLENRARMLLEVVRQVQDATGEEYPVFVKLNSEDMLDGGFSKEEMLSVCEMLQDMGIDAIELSGGTALGVAMNKLEISFCPLGNGAPYWQEAAEQYKRKLHTPLILVGGIRSIETAEALVAGGTADYISLGRPLVREPDLVARWQAGDLHKADCVSGNQCGWAGFSGTGVRCVHLNGGSGQ